MPVMAISAAARQTKRDVSLSGCRKQDPLLLLNFKDNTERILTLAAGTAGDDAVLA